MPIIKVTHQDFAVGIVAHYYFSALQLCSTSGITKSASGRMWLQGLTIDLGLQCAICVTRWRSSQGMHISGRQCHLRWAAPQSFLEAENPTETRSMQEWGWQSVDTLHKHVCLYQVRVGTCGKRISLHKLGWGDAARCCCMRWLTPLTHIDF